MYLYTPSGRDFLGITDAQMQSRLSDEIVSVNEAMVNSGIDLEFSLVQIDLVRLHHTCTKPALCLDSSASFEVLSPLLKQTISQSVEHTPW